MSDKHCSDLDMDTLQYARWPERNGFPLAVGGASSYNQKKNAEFHWRISFFG